MADCAAVERHRARQGECVVSYFLPSGRRIGRRAMLISGATALGAAGLVQAAPFGGTVAEAAPPAQAGATGAANPIQVAVEILQTPGPTFARGSAYLLYELHVTSFEAAPATLTSLTVTAPGSTGPAVRQYLGAELRELIRAIGQPPGDRDLLILQPGVRNVLYLHLRFDQVADVPHALVHRLTFAPASAGAPIREVQTTPMVVETAAPLAIGAPMHGSGWVAANALSNETGHRRTILVVNGHPYSAQRYAIDFVQIDSTGQTLRGDPSRNESYFCYGADLLAVGDGTVIQVYDGQAENVPRSGQLAVPLSFQTLAGNFAIIDLGNGRFACYAHMIPGSIVVRPGAQVRRGDVIGKVGNSGNSTEPHLHIHITDGPSFVGANGVPYVFDFALTQRTRGIENPADPQDTSFQIIDGPVYRSVLETFLNNDLVSFDRPS
jgi:hypothetical protein